MSWGELERQGAEERSVLECWEQGIAGMLWMGRCWRAGVLGSGAAGVSGGEHRAPGELGHRAVGEPR